MGKKDNGIIMGIDPGSENRTGYAIFDTTNQTYVDLGHCKELSTPSIYKHYNCCMAILEDPNQDTNMRRLAMNIRKGNRSIEFGLKLANHLGKNMYCARLIKRLLTELQIRVVHVKPSERQRADKPHPVFGKPMRIRAYSMPTKTNKRQFEQLTGYNKGSNEHSRDAATMLWGKQMLYWQGRFKTQKIK